MSDPQHNPVDSMGGSARDQRLGELINSFFDRRESGEDLTAEAFLKENPEHAEDLRKNLSGLDLLPQMHSQTVWRGPPHAESPAVGGSSQEVPIGPSRPKFPDLPGYEVLKEIGRGGMGLVYKAIQRSTKRIVAVKLLLEGPFASENARRRFEREISLAAQLRHPNIIPIYDSGVVDGRMYYAMEHIFGLALGDYLQAHPLDLRAKLKLFLKIGRAISYAHQRGVIHRDVKPSNILVDSDHEPYILDFGLAKGGALGDMGMSVTAQVIGTPAYMSPEQASGDPTGIDTRADVYSLGVVLFEMLTGQMPYETNVAIGKILNNIAEVEPPSPKKLNPQIDTELSAIVLMALEKRKEDRYQSVDAFITDLSRYLRGEPISAKPASSLYLLRKAILKNRVVLGICAILVVAAVITFVSIQYYSVKIEQKAAELREMEEKVDRHRTQVAELSEDTERMARERDEAAVARQALLNLLPPEEAERADSLTRELARGIGQGEDSATLVARMMLAAAGELGGLPAEAPAEASAESVDEGPAMSTKQDMPSGFAKEDLLNRLAQEGIPSDEATKNLLTPDVIDALKTLAGIKGFEGAAPRHRPAPATSQPTSQPADPVQSGAAAHRKASSSS